MTVLCAPSGLYSTANVKALYPTFDSYSKVKQQLRLSYTNPTEPLLDRYPSQTFVFG